MPTDRDKLDELLAEPAAPAGGHLSEYRLEQVAAGEIDDASRQHLERCEICQQQVQELAADRRAFLLHNPPQRMVPNDSRATSRPSLLRGWGLIGATALSALAMTALFILVRPLETEVAGERVKGQVSLRVQVVRGEQSWRARSGEGFLPGDALQLEIFSARPGYARVLGRVDGEISQHYPDPLHEPTLLQRGMPLHAGRKHALPQSLVLDAERRQEWLVAVVSERAVTPQQAEDLARNAACQSSGGPLKTTQKGALLICFEVTRR